MPRLSLITRWKQAGYTAYFNANDPRERDYVYEGVSYGHPLPNALWRTNHGYDGEVIRTNTAGTLS